jgi:outer membrane immunogenic protein
MSKFRAQSMSVAAVLSFVAGSGMISNAAQAEDRWSGLYMGVGIGVAWSKADIDTPRNNVTRRAARHDTVDLGESLAGSVFAGYQHQFGQFVAGVEGKLAFADLDGNTGCGYRTYRCNLEVGNISSIGGRLGYVMHNVLVYGTAGYAQANVKSYLQSGNSIIAGADSKHGGSYFGAGFDVPISERLSLGVEYTHYNLDTRYHDQNHARWTSDRYVNPTYDTIQARLTFKLGGRHDQVATVEPLK